MVLLIRRSTDRRAAPLLQLVLANLDAVAGPLENGAIVVFDEERIRIRALPLI